MRVDADLLAALAALEQLADRKQPERRVHARVGREAGIGSIDPPAVRARVPLVDGRVVLHARIGAAPRGLGDLAHQLAGRDRLADRLAGGTGDEAPLAVVLDRAHELVGDPHRVVRVLVLDRDEALAVDRHVEAGVAQRGALSSSLALHQMNSRMSGWSTSSTTIFAARRVLPPDLIVPAHASAPRMNDTGPEAVPPLASGSIEPRMFERLMPEPEPPRKIIPSCVFQSRIDSIVSSTLRMKQAEHCGLSSKPTLNQTGELNAAIWWSRMCVSSASKASPSSPAAK